MKCFFCSSLAHYKCSCSIIFLCQFDLSNHLECPGVHKTEPLDVKLEVRDQIKLQTKIIERIQIIKSTKINFISQTTKLIKALEALNDSATRHFDRFILKYYSLLGRDKVARSEMPEVSKIIKTTLEVKQLNVELDERINKAYTFGLAYERISVKEEIKQLAAMNLKDFNRFYVEQADKYQVKAIRRSNNGNYAFICKKHSGK